MAYSILTSPYDNNILVGIKLDNSVIPLNLENRDYQEVLDNIIEHGADCFEGDIPAEIQDAADTKLFNIQVINYTEAKERLSKYILSEGREARYEDMVIGQEQEEDGSYSDVTDNVMVEPSIDPLDATIMITSHDLETDEITEEEIENPLITKDKLDRAAAQDVVDNTPQPVKDHVDGV